MANFFIENYGCQMNLSEAESLAQLIEKRGHKVVSSPKDAEIVVINTCSVRESAEERIYGRLGYYRGLKNSGKEISVIVIGCMSQYAGLKLKEEFSDVLKGVWGTYNKEEILSFLDSIDKDIIHLEMKNYRFVYAVPQKKYPFKSFLTISHGCNNFCSYCIVPYVRGREICRDSDDIIENVKELVDKGVKEITLLGQNVNSYYDGKLNFPHLMDRICNSTSLERLTFLTSHPKDFSREIVDVILANRKILRYVHLPLQSGNNRILSLMNRKYTVEEYHEKIEWIRKIPDVVISTDIIVGFPTETEREFLDTVDFIKKIRFNEAYMYYYNPRPGIKANEIGGEIPEKEKKRRLSYLIEVQNKIKKELLENYVNREYNVLFEALSKKNKNELFGRSENNLIIFAGGMKEYIGKILKVRTDSVENVSLKGQIIL